MIQNDTASPNAGRSRKERTRPRAGRGGSSAPTLSRRRRCLMAGLPMPVPGIDPPHLRLHVAPQSSPPQRWRVAGRHGRCGRSSGSPEGQSPRPLPCRFLEAADGVDVGVGAGEAGAEGVEGDVRGAEAAPGFEPFDAPCRTRRRGGRRGRRRQRPPDRGPPSATNPRKRSSAALPSSSGASWGIQPSPRRAMRRSTRSVLPPAEPDGNGALDGERADAGAGNVVPLAVEVDDVVRP